MTATAHVTSPWASARRAYVIMATLLVVVAAVAIGVTYLLLRPTAPSSTASFTPLHPISNACAMTRPGLPC